MEMLQLEKLKKICGACAEIGRNLESESILSRAEVTCGQMARSGEMRLGVITGNMGTLDQITREVFDFSALPVGGNPHVVSRPCALRCGWTPDGGQYADMEILAQSGEAVFLDCGIPAQTLENIDLTLFFLNGDFGSFDWAGELEKLDYIFLTVSASHMLTAQERDFVQDVVRGTFGMNRFSIILADTNLLPSLKALEDVQDRLRWYLASLAPGLSYYVLGEDTLKSVIFDTLVPECGQLRLLAYQQSAYLCLRDTEEELKSMVRQADVDLEELKRQIEILRGREMELRRKGNLLANSMHNAFTGRIVYNAISSARQYVDRMYESICSTLDSADRVRSAAELIPGYMESALGQLSQELSRQTSNDVAVLTAEINEQMRQDAGEFFTGIPDWAVEIFGGLYASPDWMHIDPHFADAVGELSEEASSKKAENISKLLLASAVPVWIVCSFPLAVGTLAVSQMVKKLHFKDSEPDVERLKEIVRENCQGTVAHLEKEMQALAERQATETEKQIEYTYAAFVSRVLDCLTEFAAQAEESRKRRTLILRELEEEIPALREQLGILTAQDTE